MQEIINIQVGHCGNMIGLEFWELLCGEHGINENGIFVGNEKKTLQNINKFFNEIRAFSYIPRAILIDLDRSSMESVVSTPFGAIFKGNNLIFGTEGAKNNWAKAHYVEGASLCNLALNDIRREAENCDCLQGFQMIHGLGGGTGSGLGSLLISKLYEEYPSRLISTYSIVPSFTACNAVVEPYNTLLTFNHLLEFSENSLCLDNEALYGIASNTLRLNRPGLYELNYLVALAMSGVTACMRFPSSPGIDLRKISLNMTPFPRLHFYIPGYAPLTSRGNLNLKNTNVFEVVNQIFSTKNYYVTCDYTKGMYMTTACIFRGTASMKDIDKNITKVHGKESGHFVEWIPNNIKSGLCFTPPRGANIGCAVVANTTFISDLFDRTRRQYLAMFKRRAFLHWYTGEGMEEMEFEAAEANIADLIQEYREKEKS